jgi:UDP-3-O-[3-hydroxymyristoyl] glucosamine N-acyltransferase
VTLTIQEIAKICGGQLNGDPNGTITGAASLDEAVEGEIAFYNNPKYLPRLKMTRASAVLVPSDFAGKTSAAQIRVADPSKAFETVVLKLAPKPVNFPAGIHSTAVIDPKARIGAHVSIQPHVVIEAEAEIGDATVIGAGTYIGHATKIGESCFIYPNVTIRERTKIGARVIIHGGAVIGADGFGFEFKDGRQRKIPQLGIVQVDDDVEIGANTTIDRARFGRTWIQQGVKIDNLVQIAHNVVVGKHSVIAAQAGISGSARLGERATLAGQAGIVGHVTIGAGAIIAAQSGVSKNVPAGEIWFGYPATPIEETKRQVAWIHRLGKLFERVKALEKKLGL